MDSETEPQSSFKAHISDLSRRLDVQESDVWQVHDDALEMKRRGEDVILLSVGDPDFRTPEPIIDNAVSHMRVGRTHYSPALGELDLRRAIADQETRTSPHACGPEEVAILPGATSAIHVVMNCLMNQGDEIVIVDPMYVGYPPIMRAIGANVVTVKSSAENGFEPMLEDIQTAVTGATKVVFINTPGNPTGAIIGRKRLRALAQFCYDQDIWLVCDEVYSMFTFDKPHISIRAASERLENIVMINGFSKSHAMSGWRIGWVVAAPSLIRHVGNFAGMSLFGSPQFIQDAAAFALNNEEYYIRDMSNEYKKRRGFFLVHQPGRRDALPLYRRRCSGVPTPLNPILVVGGHGNAPNDGGFVRRHIDRAEAFRAVYHRDVIRHMNRDSAQNVHRGNGIGAEFKNVTQHQWNAEAPAHFESTTKRQ